MSHNAYRIISAILAATLFCSVVLPVAPAYAGTGMVGTGEVLSQSSATHDRERLLEVLERDDVVTQLEQHGVSLAEAKARVAALSDAEVKMMAERLDQMPAGANSVLGILFSIFIILLVTDLLGLTNVFPFTRSN